jgi:hypothetical protein
MSTQICCPWCQVEGVSHIGSYPTPKQVAITYCRDCLAVRGVIPLMGKSRPTPTETLLRCPWCEAAGLNRVSIAALGKGWMVAACRSCGAIHGLTPLVESKPAKAPQQHSQSKPDPATPTPPIPRPNPFGTMQLLIEIGNANLEVKKAQYEAEMSRRINMGRRGGTLYQTIALDDGPPYCLTCERDMERQVVPPGYKNSGKQIWLCPNQCGAWEAG